MKHPHYEVMMEYYKDMTKKIEIWGDAKQKWLPVQGEPYWFRTARYRIAPRPDVVITLELTGDVVKSERGEVFLSCVARTKSNRCNVLATFDAETGTLKDIGMLAKGRQEPDTASQVKEAAEQSNHNLIKELRDMKIA